MTEGKKFDNGKLLMSLSPVLGAILETDVYTRGKIKYGQHNWRSGLSWSRILDAMERHLMWFKAGEKLDPDDGQSHLASISWGAKTLMEYEYTHPELDDRYIAVPVETLRKLEKELADSRKALAEQLENKSQLETKLPTSNHVISNAYCTACKHPNGNHLDGHCTKCYVKLATYNGPCR